MGQPATRTAIPIAAFLIVIGLALWLSGQLLWRQGISELKADSRQQLDRFVSHLQAQLGRFEFVPQLLAKNHLLLDVLKDPQNSARIDLANHYLQEIDTITGAADTYLMNREGLTLAASNWQSERPFVGSNFSFRPYFQEALLGELGRYFALGTASMKRGYYFAYPIRHAAEVIGVIVLKMDLAGVEQRWSGKEEQFLVTDTDGVVFITTRPEWLYRTVRPLSVWQRETIVQSQRYPGVSLTPLELTRLRELSGKAALVRIAEEESIALASGQYLSIRYIDQDAAWTVQVLAPLFAVVERVFTMLVVIALVMLLVGTFLLMGLQRYRRGRERERFAAEAQRRLELQVNERTADITREIEERRRAEQTLRETQDELVQTAKLAVLGQLSASISHELNNPLAAIRSYADNARAFLAREQTPQVDTNLERISNLTDRMAKISLQLKVFARKSPGHFEAVSVAAAAQAAADIVKPEAKRAKAAIELALAANSPNVRADVIQLEQVLVNLLSNAIHALADAPGRWIKLHSETADGHVLIHVDDSGSGIALEDIEHIFDPFFTTRESGLGLGLSISYRIIDSMHGQLTAQNIAGGGARFTIALPLAGV